MLKGYRTYLASASGFVTGAGMVLNALVTKDYSNLGEGLVLMFVSASQFFQRAAINDK